MQNFPRIYHVIKVEEHIDNSSGVTFRYVELVEVLVRDAVSTLRRGEDGKYPERASRNQEQSRFVDIYVPPHLYGQLVQHKDGLEALLEYGDIDALVDVSIVIAK